MGRHPVERHNDELNELLERRIAAMSGDGSRQGNVSRALNEAAEMLGVTIHSINAWLKTEGTKNAIGCPKWRVDMYKCALPPELSKLTDSARAEIMSGLRYLRGAGVMSDETIAAFDKLARKQRRLAA